MIKRIKGVEAENKPAFTQYQTSNIIKEAETRIIALKKELNDVSPQLKEYEEAYKRLKLQHDVVVEKLQQDEQLLEYMSRVQNNIAPDKDIRVNRAESHNDMKDREKKKLQKAAPKARFPWTDYAVLALREEKRFTTPEDLWEIVDIKFNTEKQIKEAGLKLTGTRWGAINACWLASAKGAREGKKRKNLGAASTTEQLVEVGGRLGLRNWVDNEFKPLPAFKSLKPQAV